MLEIIGYAERERLSAYPQNRWFLAQNQIFFITRYQKVTILFRIVKYIYGETCPADYKEVFSKAKVL